MHCFSNSFWQRTLHVSDRSAVHRQGSHHCIHSNKYLSCYLCWLSALTSLAHPSILRCAPVYLGKFEACLVIHTANCLLVQCWNTCAAIKWVVINIRYDGEWPCDRNRLVGKGKPKYLIGALLDNTLFILFIR